jgi:hypothetical protein
MVGEAAAVLGRELPRLALTQVREDLSRTTVKPSVLRPQDGDLVGTSESLELAPLVRPRLDLPCDEIDPQLRQHLAHGGREGTPFRLVERQHRVSPEPFASDCFTCLALPRSSRR